MAGEAEVQEFLERLIQSGELHKSIHGRDEIEQIAASHRSDSFLPNFNLDYLLRIQSVRSAQAVLDALVDVEIVSTARKSISADKKDRLYPDLVLFSRRTGHLIIVEIKRDKQTTREAATELLAYEQEIRNQMPYINTDRIMYVIVSDSYPSLLTHAIGQTILWQQKKVLAVRLRGTKGSFSLNAILPTGWSSTRLNYVPEQCFQVAELAIRPKSANDSDALVNLVLDMTFLIAREGERMGSHGYVLVSHDHEAGENERHEDIYTIGVINAESMLGESVTRSDGSLRDNPLAAYVVGHMPNIKDAYDIITPIARPAIETLSKHGDCSFTRLGSLDEWRMGATAQGNVISRYSPYAMVLWGLPNTYREVLTHNRALSKRFRFLERLSSPQDARVGLFVLNTLTARTPFKNGEFEYQSLWQFGRSLGAALAVLRGLTGDPDAGVPHPEAALDWLGHEVLLGLFEVAFRVDAVDDLANPPMIMWGTPAVAAKLRENLEAWVAWFRVAFLARHDQHRRVFDSGMELYRIYDSYLGFIFSAHDRAALRGTAVGFAQEAYNFARHAIDAPTTPSWRKKRLLRILAESGFPIDRVDPAAATEDLWVGALPGLLAAFDELLPSVLHEVSFPDFSAVDWPWVRGEVVKARDAGNKSVAVLLFPSGEISVADLGDDNGPLPVVSDYRIEVLLAVERSGHILTVSKVKWADVISGQAFQRLAVGALPAKAE